MKLQLPQVVPAVILFPNCNFLCSTLDFILLSSYNLRGYPQNGVFFMKNFVKTLVPILLALLIIASLVWYCFVYDRDFTRDMLLKQARYHSTNGNPRAAS